jgi:hypothetical protein
MTLGRILTLAAATAALLAAPTLAPNTAEAKSKAYKGYEGQRYARVRQNNCPLRQTVNGDIVDCHGWRLRSNATGWDNTCLNLDYLPSMYACSSRGGGR